MPAAAGSTLALHLTLTTTQWSRFFLNLQKAFQKVSASAPAAGAAGLAHVDVEDGEVRAEILDPEALLSEDERRQVGGTSRLKRPV